MKPRFWAWYYAAIQRLLRSSEAEIVFGVVIAIVCFVAPFGGKIPLTAWLLIPVGMTIFAHGIYREAKA